MKTFPCTPPRVSHSRTSASILCRFYTPAGLLLDETRKCVVFRRAHRFARAHPFAPSLCPRHGTLPWGWVSRARRWFGARSGGLKLRGVKFQRARAITDVYDAKHVVWGKILSTNGRLDMQNGIGNAVFMNCLIRPGVKNVYEPTTHFTFGEKAHHRCVFGWIRALDTDQHIDYVVNPGCLDNSLQLGAVMNADSSEQLKIPVGARAYASQKISNKKRILSARALGFTSSYWLERVNVFGLELKAMRRGHAKEVIKGHRTLYQLFWLASHPCAPSTIQKTRVLVSSASEAVLATMSSVQCNMASGININSIRTENNDAIHGLARTVGQELRQLRTDSIRFDNTRTRYVEAGKASLQFVGESYEVIVTGNMTFESRLHFASRTVAKTFVRSMRPVLTRPHKPNRNVLITGGLGAIGKGYSEHVDTDAENRANLQLLGRSGRSKTFDGATLTNVCV